MRDRPVANPATSVVLILCAVVLSTAAQIIVKISLNDHGPIPIHGNDLVRYLIEIVRDPLLVGGVVLVVVASLAWYAGLSRVPLSIAFPVAALTYPLMFVGAILFLGEPFSWTGLAGNALIVGGILMTNARR